MSTEYSPLILPCIALIVSLVSVAYAVKTTRKTKFIQEELLERQRIGNDAWVEKHIQRWRDGTLASRIEKGVGVSGSDVELIEPLPGWKIVVATLIDGKRVPTGSPGN